MQPAQAPSASQVRQAPQLLPPHRHWPSGWQTRPSPQGVPCCAGSISQAPVASLHAKQGAQSGLQAHVPQSTICLQLLVIGPHKPSQVLARECGLHLELPLSRPFPLVCRFLWRFLRRLRRSLAAVSSLPNQARTPPSTGKVESSASRLRRVPPSVKARARESKCLASNLSSCHAQSRCRSGPKGSRLLRECVGDTAPDCQRESHLCAPRYTGFATGLFAERRGWEIEYRPRGNVGTHELAPGHSQRQLGKWRKISRLGARREAPLHSHQNRPR